MSSAAFGLCQEGSEVWIFGLLLALISLVDLIHDISQSGSPTAKYVSNVVKIATFLLAVILIQLERCCGFITSGVLFITFTLLVISGVVPFYSNIVEETYYSDFFEFVLYCIYFCFLLVEYFLLFWADSLPGNECRELTGKPECPETKASFPSQIVYFWIGKLLIQGYRKDLEEDDVFKLNPRDQSDNVVPDFEYAWEREKQKARAKNSLRNKDSSVRSRHNTPSTSTSETSLLLQNETIKFSKGKKSDASQVEASLLKVIIKVFGGTLFISQIIKLAADLLTFVMPMLIEHLIAFTLHRQTEREWKGYVLACSFFVVAMLKTCLYQYHFHVTMSLGMRLKSAVIAAVYKKALTISNEARKESTVGEIVNLMSVRTVREYKMLQLVSFGTYIAASKSGYLDPTTAFVSISLFGILRQPMALLPMIIPFLIQAGVSIGRVSKFLCSKDLDSDVVVRDSNSGKYL
ncbi:hypothetical protein Btru_068022 [Bulinus truncatus]|nr:hypothetical protein Btru_068022 [Bulinus truncatus]